MCPKAAPTAATAAAAATSYSAATATCGHCCRCKYRRHIFAGNGQSGGAGRSFGKDGEDVIVDVPCGTVVFDAETGEYLCEVTDDGQEVKLLRGGRGGLGNWHFKSAPTAHPAMPSPASPPLRRASCWS